MCRSEIGRNPLSSQVISNFREVPESVEARARVVIPYQVRSYQTRKAAEQNRPKTYSVVIPYQVRSYQTGMGLLTLPAGSPARRNPLSSQVISNGTRRRKQRKPLGVVIPYQVRSYQTYSLRFRPGSTPPCRNPLSSQVISNNDYDF